MNRPMVKRRDAILLGLGSLISITGCIGNDSENDAEGDGENSDRDNDEVRDGQDDFPDDPDLSTSSTESDTRNIEEDEWRHFSLEFDSVGHVSCDYVVRDGPNIDVIFMEEEEFDHFSNGDGFQYDERLTELDATSAIVEGKVDAGSYYLVFDNSDLGEATPPTNFSNDVVSVEYELTIGE